MFTTKFVRRLGTEALVAFVVTTGGAVLVTSGSFTRDIIVGATVAGLRAVIGVVVKDVGENKDTPSL